MILSPTEKKKKKPLILLFFEQISKVLITNLLTFTKITQDFWYSRKFDEELVKIY